MGDARGGPHVTSEQLAAYVHRDLDERTATELELHLSTCTSCRADLLEASRFVRVRRTRRMALIASAAGATAVLTLMITSLLGIGVATGRGDGERFRSPTTEGVLRMDIVAPVSGGRVTDPGAALRWNRVDANVSYRVTVTDLDGDEIWSRVTGDSAIALGEVTPLTQNGRYFWYVDALLPDGRSATTGVHQFELAF